MRASGWTHKKGAEVNAELMPVMRNGEIKVWLRFRSPDGRAARLTVELSLEECSDLANRAHGAYQDGLICKAELARNRAADHVG